MLLLSKMESLNLQVVAVFMPLKIKQHTIPHLKALRRSIEHTNEQGCGSTFKQCYTVLKRSILLNKRAKRWFYMTEAVCLVDKTEKFVNRPLMVNKDCNLKIT